MIQRIFVCLAFTFMLAACTYYYDALSSKPGDAERGAVLFQRGTGDVAPPCSTCHKVSVGGIGVALGPNLEGIGAIAATRVDGMSAEEYIRESILNPDSFIVPGSRVSMYPAFSDHLSEQDIADLVAYLLTLVTGTI